MQTASNSRKDPKRPTALGILRFVVLLGLGAWALVALGTWVRSLWGAVTAPGPASADEILMAGVAGLALVLGGWLWIGAVLQALSLVPGWIGRGLQPLARTVVPPLARRGVALALGVGLATGMTGMAHAASPVPSSTAAVSPSAAVPLSPAAVTVVRASPTPAEAAGALSEDPPNPGWRPNAPTVRPQPSPDLRSVSTRATDSPAPGWSPSSGWTPSSGWSPSRGAAEREPGQVVVLRGDSLWSIAAAHLGPTATDADVAAEWPRWYAANLAIIGEDPNLIHPGQVLTAPTEASR